MQQMMKKWRDGSQAFIHLFPSRSESPGLAATIRVGVLTPACMVGNEPPTSTPTYLR